MRKIVLTALAFCFLLGCKEPLMAEASVIISIPVQWHLLSEPKNTEPLFNSNSPELIESEGILLSTLPQEENLLGLDFNFDGSFGIFSHHIVRRPLFSSGTFYIGYIVHNFSDQAVSIKKTQALSFLTHPDAPFKKGPALISNPSFFSGPGSRLSMAWLEGHSNLDLSELKIESGESALLYQSPLPTNSWFILPQSNARSTLMALSANGPVYLSSVAILHTQKGLPKLRHYLDLLSAEKRAGPQEPQATLYDPLKKSQGGPFRYGRVSGVSIGFQWLNEIGLDRLEINQTLALPVSTVYLKRLGSLQNQSRSLLRRYPTSAIQAHGNYGLTYQFQFQAQNPGRFEVGFGHPINSKKELQFLEKPLDQVRYRGGLEVIDAGKSTIYHIILKEGQYIPSVQEIECNSSHCRFQIKLNYPADSTPPQVLTLKRIS